MKTYTAPPIHDVHTPIVCDVCGSTEYRSDMQTAAYRFVRCRGCGVRYQNPQPTQESLRRRYGANYFEYEIENERNFFKLMLLGLQDIGFEDLPGVEGCEGFLDIGCATGMLLDHMARRGWRTKGVEVCRESAAYGARTRGLDIHIGTLSQGALPSGSYGVVHFSHLLEHVTRPRAFLEEVRRVVHPEGYVIVTTPNIAGLQARLFGTGWRSAIGDHLYLFSKHTLRTLLEGVGFEVLRVVTWGGLAAGSVPGLIKKPVDALAKRWGFGDVVLMLARRRSTSRFLLACQT